MDKRKLSSMATKLLMETSLEKPLYLPFTVIFVIAVRCPIEVAPMKS